MKPEIYGISNGKRIVLDSNIIGDPDFKPLAEQMNLIFDTLKNGENPIDLTEIGINIDDNTTWIIRKK